ncbi:MAG TPA: peptide-N4-asparagine amidase [Mycobacteriales bacterium]|nr:peptide-N4-asparagine amidase [Mycobacteriales bacterium]
MRRVRSLATTAVLLTVVAGVGQAAADAPQLGLPTGTQQQVEADRPIPVPSTPSCTEILMTHDFANSYGSPFNGTYAPPAGCPGPWSKVVLTLTSTVAGVQFDRDVYVAIGRAVVLDGSTSEPCCTGNPITWTVQRDVTDIIPLLTASQPVQVELDNVNNATYTGVYHTVVSLTFYETDANTPEGAHPDVVLPVSSTGGGGPMLTVSRDGQRVGAPVTFPSDLSRLSAEIYADAHGPCEEFWWADPGDCAGTPYREIGIFIDGRLAGAAPAYPVTYTGASGPGLWEPIPSPRAWDLRPYDVDLTPFVGLLTDGQPHQVTLGVFDTSFQGGDFWALAANLLGWTADRGGRTKGALLSATGATAPTDAITDPTTQGVPYLDTASHTLTFVGETFAGGQRVTTTVKESMGESDRQAVLVDYGDWTWDQSTTTATDAQTTVVATHAVYGIVSDLLTSYDLTDNGSSTITVDGKQTGWTSFDESMSTADATGIVFNGAEQETYGYADSAGACYDHRLASQAGEITVDQLDGMCPGPPGS